MPKYNKLVRDNIIEIIKKDNKAYNSRILSDEEHVAEIKNKMYEELQEFQTATTLQEAVEELSDLLELINAYLGVNNLTFEQLEAVRLKKKKNVVDLIKRFT